MWALIAGLWRDHGGAAYTAGVVCGALVENAGMSHMVAFIWGT